MATTAAKSKPAAAPTRKGARLKAFTWSNGFKAYTVAASSRPKALAAWGFEHDLFKDGSAREITEGPDYEAALDSPGEVIVRGVAIDVGEITRLPRPKPKPKAEAQPEKTGPSKADLDRVKRLEARIDQLAERNRAALERLDERLTALQAERDDLARRGRRERQAAEAELAQARKVLDR